MKGGNRFAEQSSTATWEYGMGVVKKNRVATVIETVQPDLVTLKDGTIFHITKEVTAIGSSCPGPQLKTLKVMGEAASGVSIKSRPKVPLTYQFGCERESACCWRHE